MIIISDLDTCKADMHDSLFITYTITEKISKETIMNLNSFPNVTKKYRYQFSK